LALGGGIDTAAGIMLGKGVLGSGFDARGTTSGAGILNAAQGPGFTWGGPQDFNQVQQILAGMQMGSTITTGGLDTYQAGRNIISAIAANPGGTTYAQDYLGTGMNLKQLMDAAGGDMTKTAVALGLTPEMAQEQLGASVGSVLERFQDQGGDDPMSRAIRGYRESGMDITDYARQLYKSGKRDEAEAIGSYYGLVTGEGEEGGVGLMGLMGGVGTKGVKKEGPAGSIDDATKAQLKAEAEQLKKDAAALQAAYRDIIDSLKANAPMQKMMQNFGELATSAQNVITEFEKLAGVTPAVKAKVDKSGVVNKTEQALVNSSGAKAEPDTAAKKAAARR
jgi:hypothetical protein